MMLDRLDWSIWIVLMIKSISPGKKLIPPKYISGIYFLLYIIQTDIIAVGDNGMTLSLESSQVIDNLAAEEGATLFECWLINDDLRTLCLDTFHDALNGRLAEVIGIGFHCQTIDTDDA